MPEKALSQSPLPALVLSQKDRFRNTVRVPRSPAELPTAAPAVPDRPTVLLDGDGAAGASIDAGTAAHAGILIDLSLVAFELDRLGGAGLGAGTAADARIFVNFRSHFSFSPYVFEG